MTPASRASQPLASPASHIFFSQRLRLHYIDWGNNASAPMVLVHGMQDHCRTWDDLVAHLKQDYHVIAPDLRGHGDSEWVRGSAYQFMDYIYDLHQLIVQTGVGPVTLVGHSLGGAIAALFAGAFPHLVDKLVLIEGIGLWTHMQEQPAVHQRIRDWVGDTRGLAARQPRRYGSLKEAYQRMQQANPQLSSAQALHLTIHGSNQNEDGTYSWKYDNYTYNFSVASFSAEETIELWRQISCPVLIINADNGLEHRIGQDNSLRYFADAQLHVIAQAGHWTYHDDPDGVLRLMRNFLS